MRIRCDLLRLRDVRPAELAWRFGLGAGVTAAAGIIAVVYGPSVGGLFLAFPAILPATLTLVATHQEQRKAHVGVRGVVRGRQAAALDAYGAALGALGLMGFAIVVHLGSTKLNAPLALTIATIVWMAVTSGMWMLRMRRPRSRS
ncbi:MAG TPA: hypothetical protein VLV86_11060 [Vicinamibacterales bacterium]|nr:hypothetical protein [Vicinamibacterales bacterium]